MKSRNILLCGVGGQGIITMGRLIGTALVDKGVKVRIAEVHGLAQRGGSVNVHVRFGEDVYSPLICKGKAQALVALELIEAIRYLSYLSENGILLVNDALIPPPLPKIKIPNRKEILEEFKRLNIEFYIVDATKIAMKAGSAASTNVVMLGGMLALDLLPLTLQDIERSIKEILPPKFHEVNLKALKMGFEEVAKLKRTL